MTMNKMKTEKMMYPASRDFPLAWLFFSVHEVVRVASKSRSWFVLYTPCSQDNDDDDDDDDNDDDDDDDGVCNDGDEQEDNKNKDDDENGDNDGDDVT